jgi:hypothetical protein
VHPVVEQVDQRSERLWADYRAAFRNWALELDRLQGLPTAATECFVKEAKDRVEAAEGVYRCSRNLLTDDMNHPGE